MGYALLINTLKLGQELISFKYYCLTELPAKSLSSCPPQTLPAGTLDISSWKLQQRTESGPYLGVTRACAFHRGSPNIYILDCFMSCTTTGVTLFIGRGHSVQYIRPLHLTCQLTWLYTHSNTPYAISEYRKQI